MRRVRDASTAGQSRGQIIESVSVETTVQYSCVPPLGLYDLDVSFNGCRFKSPCFGGRGAYRKTRGTNPRALRNDTVSLYGSLQHAWLSSAQSSGSHYVWRNRSRQTGNNSVSTNGRVLKVSAVHTPSRIDPPVGFFFHEITNSFDDHQSPTSFTRHIVSSLRLSLLFLCEHWWPERFD